MKYLSVINSFWDSATTNPLSTGQVSLYMALLHVCNRSNWAEWFQAPNQVLSVLTGLSRSGILKARNELKQRGLLDFRERGTKATLYRIIIANSKQESVQDCMQNGVQDCMQNGVQDCKQESTQNSGTLKDIDKDIDKERYKMRAPMVECFEVFYEAYPKHGNDRPAAERAYCKVLREDCHITEQDLVAAAANYADSMKILEREKKFIRSAASFLTDDFFAAYLPGQYVRPEKSRNASAGKKNSFNQFTQNKYDFGALEDELLAN